MEEERKKGRSGGVVFGAMLSTIIGLPRRHSEKKRREKKGGGVYLAFMPLYVSCPGGEEKTRGRETAPHIEQGSSARSCNSSC